MANHGGQRVFAVSALIILALVAVGAAFPDGFAAAASAALSTTTRLFGWFYLFSVFGFVLFLLGLAFSKYGKIRLGPQDSSTSFTGSACCWPRASAWGWCSTAWPSP